MGLQSDACGLDERAGLGGQVLLVADAEVDLALDHVERLVPGVAVWRGPLPSVPLRWRIS